MSRGASYLSLGRNLLGQTWLFAAPGEGLQLALCSFCLCCSEDAIKWEHERFLTNQLLCRDK